MRFTTVLTLLAALAAAQTTDYTQYVQVFMGTEGGGNMFPGVARPFGMAKIGPDLYTGADAYSGYLPTGNVTGITMMHESGTGGAPKYGVVHQMPVVGKIANPLGDHSQPRSVNDTGSVGAYSIHLASGANVSLAATAHAGILSYSFPRTQRASVLIDVSHVLPSFRGLGLSQGYAGGQIRVFGDGHYESYGIYNNGWNEAPNWKIFACGRFNQKPASIKLFSGSGSNVDTFSSATTMTSTSAARVGAVYQFKNGTTSVESRVGISWISSAKACSFLDDELPSTKTLAKVQRETKTQWNTEVLSKVTTPVTDPESLQLLYSSMYGMMLIPSNRTGENPLWTSTEPYYDDEFTLWDLHRCSTALMQVLQPAAYEEQIRSLIDIWRHSGWMPDARSSNYNGRSQGGSNADNVLADAYVKGVRGAVNWDDGYQAMVKDAEVTPPNNHDPQAPDSSDKEGRGALPDWLERGYITPKYSRAVSRAVEYSVNDFALSQVAKGLGNTDDYNKYLNRSHNWRNHWDNNTASLGFSGFMVPRNADGTFVQQDPLSCNGCYWADAYYEALPWEYSMGMTHDVATLVNYTGGPDRFVERLETMFTPGLNPPSSTGSAQFNYTIFNPSNEPDFTTAYLYHFAGRPDLSTKHSRSVARTYYNPSTTGLPGNSDAGAMQTWLLWNMIGLYPMTSMTTFLIHAPWYAMTIDLGSGHSLKVTTNSGVDPDTDIYVQKLIVNGKPWRKNWLTWNDVFAAGGTMDFTLGPTPSSWFTGPLPPSPGSL